MATRTARIAPHRPPAAEIDGRPRRVGVEIEFGDISSRDAAQVVRDLFGGTVVEHDPYHHAVTGTPYGSFTVKLDTQYAHPTLDLGKFGLPQGDKVRDQLEQVLAAASRFAGDISQFWVPTEVVSPPLPWPELGLMDDLLVRLAERGATGTRAQPWYAFGLHLNPEAPALDARSLHTHLCAYVLAEDWLRARSNLDDLRRLLPFIDPFPDTYRHALLRRDDAPDIDGLISAYLADNPTRNRGLDMLPLFAWLRPHRIAEALGDPRISGRPTFHYRMPNGTLEGAAGKVVQDWNRWLVVERLAALPEPFNALRRLWRESDGGRQRGGWLALSTPVLDALLAEAS